MTKQKTQSKHKLPGDAYADHIRARFWLMGSGGTYVGIGRVTLMEKIARLGSINQAAKEMGMSYKKAWGLMEELNQMFDEPLVVKAHGGKSGGGTRLTEKGEQVLVEFRRVEQQLTAFLQSQSQQVAENLGLPTLSNGTATESEK